MLYLLSLIRAQNRKRDTPRAKRGEEVPKFKESVLVPLAFLFLSLLPSFFHVFGGNRRSHLQLSREALI